jgi:hypothetical protein
MQLLSNGFKVYDSLGELYYDLFTEIGLAIGPDQYLYDQDTRQPLVFKEKYIKASITGEPVYPGRNDIVFDPAGNYALISTLFGYYLDKAIRSEDGDMVGGYIAHYIDDDDEKMKQRVVVRSSTRGDISSAYYYNIYLAYIDCIFKVAGDNVDLSNFDSYIEPEEKKKRRR